ncbi:MAG: prephenate dehydrogenase/arogenate dehydrogenase family protein [Candidatus Omnitrophica bacterium]|nr:prephenate dehydrogenase/arogenate dehydrogenase family protein [Candidatus Omnitrophota bacterium]MBU0895907.1 prephenate dehydrogenase/arogenate dehydrogenase family protein [Candidatus Omnitrophota bacterium]MBU1809183.1 prephenate dehydrogenase/arogenate dehydrogenase family protein [Candidatus Omnitrophota bacterium]
MAQFNKIAIIGVGLIGGSIGLAIKKSGCAREVIGVFHREVTLKKALKCKAVDSGVMNVADGVRAADLIIIAAPVHLIPALAARAMKNAKPGAIITDAGSTKEWIVNKIEKTPGKPANVYFVGSHPMAGSEHAGVRFAREDLFEESPCIVTRTPRTDPGALAQISRFWRSLGGRIKVMSPREHDRTVSLISHLPHVVAFSLAGAVPVKEMACAAEGFRDTTRVASSDPELWADIFLTNRKAVSDAGALFGRQYYKLLKAIATGNRLLTVSILRHSKSKRDKLLPRHPTS